jgi:hypothetical protein
MRGGERKPTTEFEVSEVKKFQSDVSVLSHLSL